MTVGVNTYMATPAIKMMKARAASDARRQEAEIVVDALIIGIKLMGSAIAQHRAGIIALLIICIAHIEEQLRRTAAPLLDLPI